MECGRWTAGVGVQEENRRGGQFAANDGEVVGGVVGEGLQLREFAGDDAAQQQKGYGGDENLAEVNAVANHGEARATIHLGGRHGKGENRRARLAARGGRVDTSLVERQYNNSVRAASGRDSKSHARFFVWNVALHFMDAPACGKEVREVALLVAERSGRVYFLGSVETRGGI